MVESSSLLNCRALIGSKGSNPLLSAKTKSTLAGAFCFSGVSWTKFELFMNKIRRILMTNARAERVVALNQIVRIRVRDGANSARLALLPVANQNQKFPYQSI